MNVVAEVGLCCHAGIWCQGLMWSTTALAHESQVGGSDVDDAWFAHRHIFYFICCPASFDVQYTWKPKISFIIADLAPILYIGFCSIALFHWVIYFYCMWCMAIALWVPRVKQLSNYLLGPGLYCWCFPHKFTHSENSSEFCTEIILSRLTTTFSEQFLWTASHDSMASNENAFVWHGILILL